VLEKRVRKKIVGIVGKQQVLARPADLALYGYDATPQADPCMPDLVVLPKNAEQISGLVRLANQERFCVVPRGAGTNLTGGARPIHGGVVLSTQKLNRILLVDEQNLQVVVQPGVVVKDLQAAVAKSGLFYPPDPQSKETCTIGGNLAENAGGPRAVKYGVTRQYALALDVVLPQGDLVKLGANTLKSVAGYDLVSLLIGSEGTLGIISAATLRLLPQPESNATLQLVFDDLRRAASAVSAILQAGVIPSALEFIDKEAIRSVEAYQSVGLSNHAEAVLVVEVDGSSAQVEHAAQQVEKVAKENGTTEIKRARTEKDAEKLWKARRMVGPSLARIAPLKFNEDIVVPISRLPDAVTGVHGIAKRHHLPCACFGHAGDGNIHVNFLLEPGDEKRLKRVGKAISETFDLVIELGGSITGEHGVGTTKQPYLSKELSGPVMSAMRSIKAALDPNNILNPGKIFP
jgi:glycolate oxidase subunit GlcD